MKKKVILGIIITSQIFIIIFLFTYISNTNRQVLGQNNVNYIAKDQVHFPEETSLKYYFEHSPYSSYTEPKMPWLDQTITYTFNNGGFNNINDYKEEKPASTFRIIALGDSFTQGMFVATGKNWVTILENNLNEQKNCSSINKIEVLNLGVSGHDIQHAVETYQRKGIKYNPDLVIWFLKEDDFIDINELMRENQEKYTIELKNSGKYDELVKNGDPYPFASMLGKDMQKIRESLGEDYIYSKQNEFINEFLSSYQNKILFITMPFGKDRYRDYLKDLTKKRDDTFYFELTSTANSKEYSFYPHDIHPNEKGHQRIAHELSQYFSDKDIMKCK